MPAEQRRKRIVSGSQPTGTLHIGNYVGALKSWVGNQDQYECLFLVADMYAIKNPEAIDAAKLREKTLEFAALFLACGIDPNKSTIFIQSQVPAHAQLAWVLSCLTPLERLQRQVYESESGGGVSTGLLLLPVLLAADILLYDTGFVPIGEDQRQHVEFVSYIARRFNSLYAPLMKSPQPLIRKKGTLIMGLDDPTVKMSKSIGATRKGHMIGLLDSAGDIKNAIMSAATDPGNTISFKHSKAGVKNLLVLYEALSGMSRADIEKELKDKSYELLKKHLVDLVADTLRPIQQKYYQIRDNTDYLEAILATGAEHARKIADPRIEMIKGAVGFRTGAKNLD